MYSSEPPPESSQDLLQHPRLVCTPHLGASTEEAQVMYKLCMFVATAVSDARPHRLPVSMFMCWKILFGLAGLGLAWPSMAWRSRVAPCFSMISVICSGWTLPDLPIRPAVFWLHVFTFALSSSGERCTRCGGADVRHPRGQGLHGGGQCLVHGCSQRGR